MEERVLEDGRGSLQTVGREAAQKAAGGKHQDLILLAVAKREEAIVVTADSDLLRFVEKGGIDVAKRNVHSETCVDEALDALVEPH